MEFDGSLDFLNDDVDFSAEIDWDFLFDENANALDDAAGKAAAADSPSASSSGSSTVEDAPANVENGATDAWIGELENMLMKDDDVSKAALEAEPPKEFYESFLADLLVDSPAAAQTDVPADVDSTSNGRAESEKEKSGGSPINDDTDADVDGDDPVSKKRKRQLRNKDAAMRSRGRRKMYVTDLEMKSKYLEGECRRLGRLLQCCYAENHALRLGLQMGNAYGRDVSGTKQESAVLVMELLLLGSLLWFLDLTCLFTLPLMPHLLLLTLSQEQARKESEGAGPIARGEASKTVLALESRSFVMTRRCKASRTKMRYGFLVS